MDIYKEYDKKLKEINQTVKKTTSKAKSKKSNPFGYGTIAGGLYDLTGGDISKMGVKNKQAEGVKKAYDKQSEVDLNEDAMFTGNPYFDIGLAMGRSRKKKMKAAKKQK